MALITTLTEEPTGAYAATLPVLAIALHSVGVSTYDNRWVARDLTGATLHEWTATSGVKLTANASANDPAIVTSSVGAIKALSFDGVDDALRNTALPATQKTMILVARITAADGAGVSMLSGNDDDIQMVRNSSNQMGVFAPGSGVSVSTATETGGLWHVFGLRLDATEATVWRDGTKLATAASSGLGLGGIRLPVGGGAFGKMEIAEFITYPTALTDADMMTIKTALKQTYTVLP
jgi:hypothetical protein